MSALLFAVLLFGADATAADVKNADPDKKPGQQLTGDFTPALFAGVAPGTTTPDAAVRRIGAPHGDYKAWVVADEIDLFVEFPSPDALLEVHARAKKMKRKAVEVRVLEYRHPEAVSRVARLVFLGDCLWYALIPASASELTPQKIEGRFGRAPLQSTRTRTSRDLVLSLKVFAYPEEGVAYLMEGSDDYFKTKCVFPPVRK